MMTPRQIPPVDGVRNLYVHIPFCPAKCSYCAFVTHIGSNKLIPPYVDAVRAHIEMAAAARTHASLETLYFGGGTPTMLTEAQVAGILAAARSAFGLGAGAEITMEGHPATVSRLSLAGYLARGVNRISFGAESMIPEELAAIGRTHTPVDLARALSAARDAGFENIALDLIYGLPTQTSATWRDGLGRALELGPDHLSLYSLSIEPRSVFARRQREGSLHVPDDDRVVEMYEIACETLRAAGYEHYELSSWALPGKQCRHNVAYWSNRPYAAVGVGAHGFLPPYRFENVRRVSEYLRLISEGAEPVAWRERIGPAESREETVFLRLRLLREGLDTTWLRRTTGRDLRSESRARIDALVGQGLLTDDGTILRLTERGVPVSNEVFASLM